MSSSGPKDASHNSTEHGDQPAGAKAEKQSQNNSGAFGTFARIYRDAAPYLALGIQLAATVIILFYVGYWADDYFGTRPWLMIAGLAVGVITGFYNFFKTVIDLGKKEEKH